MENKTRDIYIFTSVCLPPVCRETIEKVSHSSSSDIDEKTDDKSVLV